MSDVRRFTMTPHKIIFYHERGTAYEFKYDIRKVDGKYELQKTPVPKYHKEHMEMTLELFQDLKVVWGEDTIDECVKAFNDELESICVPKLDVEEERALRMMLEEYK